MCKTAMPSSPLSDIGLAGGGSTFEVYAFNEHSLIRCSMSSDSYLLQETKATSFQPINKNKEMPLPIPSHNSTYDYHYNCDMPLYIHTSLGEHHSTIPHSTSCLHVTVLLQYEHFDAFSETLAANVYRDYIYPPMGLPIVDNEMFCVGVGGHRRRFSLLKRHLQTENNQTPHTQHASGGTANVVEYVTGFWRRLSATTAAVHV